MRTRNENELIECSVPVMMLGVAVPQNTVSCLYFFFFSSRRRHTRLQGDWSSDVCSSDLAAQLVEVRHPRFCRGGAGRCHQQAQGIVVPTVDTARSEERRVGKECRSRWSPYH